MEKSNIHDDEVKKIIWFYRTLSFWFVKFWIFILFILIWIVLLVLFKPIRWFDIFLYANNIISMKEYNVWYKKIINWYQWDLVDFSNDPVLNKLNISILYWPFYLDSSKKFKYSYNNLVDQWWFVFPLNSKTSVDLELKWIMPFDDWSYAYDDLLNYIDNVVLSKYDWMEISLDRPVMESIKDNNLIDMFSLSCLLWKWTNSPFCKVNIDNFFNRVFMYKVWINDKILDLETDNDNFSKIFYKLLEVWYKDKLCMSMSRYLSMSFDTREFLEWYYESCWWNVRSDYNKVLAFNEILQNYKKNNFSSTIYSDKQLNHLKLVSIMNSFYNGKPRLNSLNSYNNMVRNLLKWWRINDIYKDIIYVFNNKYLISKLKDEGEKETYMSKADANKLIDQIMDINKWWLEEWLVNKWLVEHMRWDINNIVVKQNRISLDSQFNNLLIRFPFIVPLSALKINESKGTATIDNWKFVVYIQSEKTNIELKFTNLIIKIDENGVSFVNQVFLIWMDKENAILSDMIKKNWVSVGDLKWFLADQVSVSNTKKLSLCQMINKDEKFKTWWSWEIKQCNDETIIFDQNWIDYIFEFNSQQLVDFEISDKNIDVVIKQNNKWKLVLLENLPQFIYDVLRVKLEWDSHIDINDATIINNKLDTYFWVKARSIKWSRWVFLIKFMIWSHNFEWTLNFNKNYRLSSVKLIIESGAKNQIYQITWLELYLIDKYKNELNLFKDDPIKYMNWIDSDSIDNYIKALKK